MTPFSFRILFTFIYLLRIKKQHCHFISFGPFCTYSFPRVLALPQVLPFFYFYHSCSHVLSFIILFFFDSPWLPLTPFLLYFYSADCAFSSSMFHFLLHWCIHLPFVSFISHNCDMYSFFLFILLLVYSIAYMYIVWLSSRLAIYKEDERKPRGQDFILATVT